MKMIEKNSGKFKGYIKPIATVCVLQVLFAVLMTLCALIPRDAIADNVKKCADYYSNRYMFQQMTKDEDSTVVHNYADLVWLNIAWFQNSDAPFTSAIDARFYEGEGIYKSESLIEAVYDEASADQSYSRYWHGALVFIKPLLTMLDISGIRCMNAAVCVCLALGLSAMLLRRRRFALFVGYWTALILCFAYIVPICMEYMPCFVIMHIAGMVCIARGENWDNNKIQTFFAIVGAVTCFFDFLTNEILTLFVPLIFLICVRDKKISTEKYRTIAEGIRSGASWLFGYAFTWLSKWLLCLFTLGKEAFGKAISDGAYRMAGTVPSIEQNQIAGAIVKNLNRLFPFNLLQSEAEVWLAAFAAVFVLFCVFFLYRKEKMPRGVWALLLIACAPYVRYAALNNHSCLHPFFTFRTQMITVIALFAAFEKGIDFRSAEGRRRDADKNKRKNPKKRINGFDAVPK